MLKALLQRLRIGGPRLRGSAAKRTLYLCSYPKSGRTWLRFIVGHYLTLKFDLEVELDFDSIFTILPNLSTKRGRGLDVYGYMQDARLPLLLSSHAQYDRSRFGDGDVIFVLRGIGDVMVSSYFHETRQRRESQRYAGDVKSFIRDQRGLTDYLDYQNSWAAELERRRSLILTYEQLKHASEMTVSRVLEFLGVEVDAAPLREALGRSSFSRMQDTEIRKKISGQQYDPSDPQARRVRQGKIGGYIEHLDREDVAYIRERCEHELVHEARELLTQHRVLL